MAASTAASKLKVKLRGRGPAKAPSAKAGGSETAPVRPKALGRREPAFGRKKSAVDRNDLGLPTSLTGLPAHDLVTKGVPVGAATKLMESLRIIEPSAFYSVLGISERTFQRRAASKSATLDPNASDRTLRLAAVTKQAIRVLGDQDKAERWLSTPAIALDRRKPIDLLRSTEGTEMVKTLLTRMDYGVYA